MKKSLLAVTIALAVSTHAQFAFAQAATATGGAGGAGGSATGGTAAGGAATNSNTLSTTGGTGGQGGVGGTGGTSTAAGGSATATGVQTGPISSTGNSQAAEVTVNYITPVSPGGLKGLAAGVDPETGHFVNDNNVNYNGSYKIKNTPDVSIGGPASGPCNGFSGGIGFSGPGFAIGANTSTVDPGCTARETARIAAMLGRMDIANAVLENTSVVQEALKAKAARQAAEAPPPAVATPAAPVQTFPLPAQSNSDRAIEEARLREQQRLAVEALQRKATMEKVYDNLTFTDAATQASEKTPQQVMAEETIKTQAERAKRLAVQKQLERRLAALKSEAPERRQNALAPEVPDVKLALTAPATAPASTLAAAPTAVADSAPVATPAPVAVAAPAAAPAPVAPPAPVAVAAPAAAPAPVAAPAAAVAAPAAAPAPVATSAPVATAPVAAPAASPAASPPSAKATQSESPVDVASNKAPDKAPAPAPSKAMPTLDSVEAAKLLLNVEPSANKATAAQTEKVTGEGAERGSAASAQPAPAPAQPRKNRDAVPAPQEQLASQPMLRNVKMDKLNDMFGFSGKQPATDEVAPDEGARKSTPKATEPAVKPATQQTAKRGAPAEKPANEATNKAPVQPADALNIAKVVVEVQ